MPVVTRYRHRDRQRQTARQMYAMSASTICHHLGIDRCTAISPHPEEFIYYISLPVCCRAFPLVRLFGTIIGVVQTYVIVCHTSWSGYWTDRVQNQTQPQSTSQLKSFWHDWSARITTWRENEQISLILIGLSYQKSISLKVKRRYIRQ